jgi:glutamate synthase domain-containing protein 2
MSHHRHYLDSIAIVPAQLYGSPPRDPLREPVKAELVLGEKSLLKPLILKTPVMLAGTPETCKDVSARKALINGSAKAGSIADCGWLGLTEDEIDEAEGSGALTMVQLTTSRLGTTMPVLSGAGAISLALTHGGTGSPEGAASSVIVPGELAPKLSENLGISNPSAVFASPRMLDMDTPRDLNLLVQLLREITRHKTPVMVEVGPGRIYNDIRIAVNAKPDGIILDCTEPTVPETAVDSAGTSVLPPLTMLAPVQKALKDSKAEKAGIKLIYKGDLRGGADIFKVMAFGASGVMITSAPLKAAGLTDDGPSRIEPERAGTKIAGFMQDALADLQALTAWAGHDSISDITTDDLRALEYDTAAVTGLKLAGYENILTMWEH